MFAVCLAGFVVHDSTALRWMERGGLWPWNAGGWTIFIATAQQKGSLLRAGIGGAQAHLAAVTEGASTLRGISCFLANPRMTVEALLYACGAGLHGLP